MAGDTTQAPRRAYVHNIHQQLVDVDWALQSMNAILTWTNIGSCPMPPKGSEKPQTEYERTRPHGLNNGHAYEEAINRD